MMVVIYACRQVNLSTTGNASQKPGKVCATEFGLYDGAPLDGIIKNAINYCITNSVGYLSVPPLGPAGHTISGGLEFINSTNGLIIEGPGMGTKGSTPVITHTGANVAPDV